jgi:hypothetical protein
MKIKLIKSYGLADAGEVLEVTAGVAELLIKREIAVAMAEQRGGKNDTNKMFTKPPKK